MSILKEIVTALQNKADAVGFKKLKEAITVPAEPERPTLDELYYKTMEWGEERLITVNSTPQAQLLKCVSELGELADATLKDDRNEIVDGVGDVLVTLVMYATIQRLDLAHCLECAYDEIKDRKGHLTPEGVFVKEE